MMVAALAGAVLLLAAADFLKPLVSFAVCAVFSAMACFTGEDWHPVAIKKRKDNTDKHLLRRESPVVFIAILIYASKTRRFVKNAGRNLLLYMPVRKK